MSSNLGDIVLVVDDSPESLGMLNAALNSQGYTALVALDGLQALAIIEKVQPAVILLDAMMPQMDGFEACHKLKQQLPNTPIIFMTGLSDSEDVVRGFEAGAIDYVTKPISPNEVIARIKTHIETAKLALSAQEALDHSGTNVFCVSSQGRLSWATPNVHKIIDKIAKDNPIPWANIATELEAWLSTDTTKNLTIKCFEQPFEVFYESQQDDKHLLHIVANKEKKTAKCLQDNLPVTKRESEVLYWVSYGKTSWEISQILEMSPRTVNKHLEQIYKKLGVDNRTSAAAISLRLLDH